MRGAGNHLVLENSVTSRESTGFLPLQEDVHPEVIRKSLSDRATTLAFGAIGWPWLLRSLSGGSPEMRSALLQRLGLGAEALPHLGSWKADAGFLTLIADCIFETLPENVVEFGCGASSLVIARALQMNGSGTLVSFDQHAEYVAATREWLAGHGLAADIRHAPLTRLSRDWPGRWYECFSPPERIDMLVLDGPPWAVHPFGRGAADCLFERLPSGGIILLDDAARPGERVIASRWRKRWPAIDFRYVSAGTKGALIGRKR